VDAFLGLDVSTSIIGWALLPQKIDVCAGGQKPLCMGHIDLRKVKGGFWNKVDISYGMFESLKEMLVTQGYIITGIFIEEPLKKFSRGKSSASTLSLLSRFNAIVSFFMRQLFSVEPLYIDATVARRKLGIPLVSRKKSGLSHKEQVIKFLMEGVFRDISWPVTKTGLVQQWVGDELDAYVICIAGCLGLGEHA
jgi:hypothetical protein